MKPLQDYYLYNLTQGIARAHPWAIAYTLQGYNVQNINIYVYKRTYRLRTFTGERLLSVLQLYRNIESSLQRCIQDTVRLFTQYHIPLCVKLQGNYPYPLQGKMIFPATFTKDPCSFSHYPVEGTGSFPARNNKEP